MFPILAQLGPITLYAYPTLINLGLAAGLAWLYFTAPAEARLRRLDAGIAAIAGGLIGARLLYVIVNGEYYAAHIFEVFEIWRGGLAWPGAAFGGLLGVWLYARRFGEPIYPVLDALALPIGWVGALAWAGCLASSCAYGAEVAPGELPAWFTLIAPDIYGLIVPRWPTQAVGVLLSVLAIGLAWAMRGRGWPAGALGSYSLSLIALIAFALGFTRGDPIPLVGGFRLDVIGSGLVLLAATGGWAALASSRPADRPSSVSNS